jgi:hypothetical protein
MAVTVPRGGEGEGGGGEGTGGGGKGWGGGGEGWGGGAGEGNSHTGWYEAPVSSKVCQALLTAPYASPTVAAPDQ